MKKNIEKTLLEMFGDPIDPVFGTKVGDVKDIKKIGAVGVRGGDDLGEVCDQCQMMSIDGMCGCDQGDQEIEIVDMQQDSLGGMCQSCGLPENQCLCSLTSASKPEMESSGCPICGMMSTDIDNPIGCGMNGEGCGKMDEKSCSQCGMVEGICECGYMTEAKKRSKVKSKKYQGKEYKASAGSVAAIKKHGGSKKKH